MTRIAIVTDSTADLPAHLASAEHITVVPLNLDLDGVTYRDGVDIEAAAFYERLAGATAHPTTSQPSPGAFQEVYERLLRDHDGVVSLHISERLSGTLSSARMAAAIVDPERIHAVDSGFVSMPLAALATVAARVAAGDAGTAEIITEVDRVRAGLECYFAVATLEFLRRGGRIGGASALLGSVLQIKPILCIRGGEVTPLERVRTQDRALARVHDLVAAVDSGHGVVAIIGHAGAEAAAQGLAARLDPLCESLVVQPLGPVVGAHAGPGTVGVAVYPAELFPLGLRHGVGVVGTPA